MVTNASLRKFQKCHLRFCCTSMDTAPSMTARKHRQHSHVNINLTGNKMFNKGTFVDGVDMKVTGPEHYIFLGTHEIKVVFF